MKEKGQEACGIHFPPTRAPTRQLAAPLQSYCCLQRHYWAREMSGDDEASVVPLTVGHAVSHAPSRHPQMSFGGLYGGEWRCS
jgi:hypothetical protein